MELLEQTYIGKATKLGTGIWVLIPISARRSLLLEKDEKVIITIRKEIPNNPIRIPQ